jgi:Ca2+-binding EF-hand superfamily protein
MIEQFDANRDGKLDDAERARLRAARQARHAQRKGELLAKFDANKDGRLDDAERAGIRAERAAARFAALDANHDGKLTLDEFKLGQDRHARGHGRYGRRPHHRRIAE